MTREMAENLPEREEAVEMLPSNIGEMAPAEAAPLLNSAASRIDILRPKNEFWEGVKENLRGAAGYIEAQKAKIGSRALRTVAGVSLVTTMVAACARTPETPYMPPTEPVVTQPIGAPTETPTVTPMPTETPTAMEASLDLPIIRKFEMNKFQDLPEITIEQAQSPAFEKFLDDAEQKGLLGDFPSTAKPFEPVFGLLSLSDETTNPAFDLSSDLRNEGTYSDINLRPCYNAAYFRTTMNGEDYILWVQKWKNEDGFVGRIKYIYSYKLLQSVQSRYDIGLFGFTSPSKQVVLVPGIPGENPNYSVFWQRDDFYFKNYWQQNKDAMLKVYQDLIDNKPKNIKTSDFAPYLWTPVGTLAYY